MTSERVSFKWCLFHPDPRNISRAHCWIWENSDILDSSAQRLNPPLSTPCWKTRRHEMAQSTSFTGRPLMLCNVSHSHCWKSAFFGISLQPSHWPLPAFVELTRPLKYQSRRAFATPLIQALLYFIPKHEKRVLRLLKTEWSDLRKKNTWNNRRFDSNIHWYKFGARWSSSSGGTRKILFGAVFH